MHGFLPQGASFLEKALEYNPAISITLEMPVHDSAGQKMEEIMAEEKAAIEKSTAYLFKLF